MISVDEFDVENVIMEDPQYFTVNDCYLCKIFYKYPDAIGPLRFILPLSKSNGVEQQYQGNNHVIYNICFEVDNGERINDIFKEIYAIILRKQYESVFDGIIRQDYIISEEECKFPIENSKGKTLLTPRVLKNRTQFININNQQDLSWNFVTQFGLSGEPYITIEDIRITTSKTCEIRLICNELKVHNAFPKSIAVIPKYTIEHLIENISGRNPPYN